MKTALTIAAAALCAALAMPAQAAQLSGDARAAIPHDVQQLVVIDYRAMQNSATAMSLRERVMQMETLADLQRILDEVDPNEPFPLSAVRVQRGKSGGTQTVSLPHGYLDDLDDTSVPEEANCEEMSGG